MATSSLLASRLYDKDFTWSNERARIHLSYAAKREIGYGLAA